MPSRLRVAAEWQFGAALLPIIAFAVRGPLWAAPVFALLSVGSWLRLSSSRFSDHRTLWWMQVLGTVAMWLFIGIGILFFDTT
jgi:hypothetical protein